MYNGFLDTDFNDAFMLDKMVESDTWEVSEMDYASASGTKTTKYMMIPVLRWNTADFFDSQKGVVNGFSDDGFSHQNIWH